MGKSIAWILGGLVVVVGSFLMTDAVHVWGINQRYAVSIENPEAGSASAYEVKVYVPAGTGQITYQINHAGLVNKVTVNEQATARWVNLGTFSSKDQGNFTVEELNVPERTQGPSAGPLTQFIPE
ncbi:hypothetical protein [Sulfobacillus thermosulfidooxidans]|uniref:hypothetical protein n=1 Tax=Sulfobacillus thermosulfidooxidans TaxID=28034 RepID=UPI00041963BD|nr:hypothetical protein [Sulfobacillus thermosulfidooxidans]